MAQAVRSWSAEEIVEIFEKVSNWGRWGPDDELGTLNLITPQKRRQAAALVRSGRLLSVGKDLSTVASPMNPRPIVHTMHDGGPDPHGASDELLTHNHGPQTHMDPTSHMFFRGRVYPGKRVSEVLHADGLSFGSVYAKREGILTRGVLLDVPGARGVDYLEPEDMITADDLAAAERLSGVAVEPGDAIFIRAGLGAYQAATGNLEIKQRTGLGPDCALWIRAKDAAVVCNDCPEKLPSICPEIGLIWHIAGLVFLGVTFVESPDLERLRRACAEEGRSEFMFVVAPQRFPRGTGNLVNPLVAF